MENIHGTELEAGLKHAVKQHFTADHTTLMRCDMQNQNRLFQFCFFCRRVWLSRGKR